MAYKTKAYRKTKNGYELISRDYFCSLDTADQRIFRDNNKPFYLEPSDLSPKLTYNIKNRTYSFYPTFDDSKFFGSNEESYTHTCCIEELAKLKELPIKIDKPFADKRTGELVTFSFNYAFPEIILHVGEYYIKPDLLLYLREPSDLALRWNRLLAIEVVVSHDVNGEKLELMKNAKIPILRIKANKKWGRKKDYEMTEDKKDELRNWIKNSFKKGFSGDLLLDVKSKAILENRTIQQLEVKRDELLFKIHELSKENHKLQNDNHTLQDTVNTLTKENYAKLSASDIKDQNIAELNGEVLRLSNRNSKLKKNLFRCLFTLLALVVLETVIIYFFGS